MRIRFLQNLFPFWRGDASSGTKDSPTAKIKSGVGDVRDRFEPSSRQNGYWSGKLLTESDFTQEQSYQRQKKSDVAVVFQEGETRTATVVGNLWNSEDRPPVKESDDDSKD